MDALLDCVFPCLATPSSILRNGNYNVTFNYTSVRGNLTEPPLVNSNISWCPADDDLLRNPVLIVDLGESVECVYVRPRTHLPFPLENGKFTLQFGLSCENAPPGGVSTGTSRNEPQVIKVVRKLIKMK